MKRRVVELLQCPGCSGSLDLQVLSEQPEKVQVAVERPRCARYCALLDVAIGPGSDPSRFDCQACYEREVREGFLACTGCRLVFPIIDGVPRLLRQAQDDYREFFLERREHVAASRGREGLEKTLDGGNPSVFDRRTHESFSLQWQQYQYEDKTWFKDDLSLRQQELLRSLDLPASDLVGASILDVGCGNGRLTATMGRYGAEVVGMDLSRSVGRANQNRQALAGDRAPFVHFVQGNIMEAPLRAESFDIVHTSGVLHHTPDTWRAFTQFLMLGRPGARTYVQLYRRRELWVRMVNTPLRLVTTRLPVGLLYRLCDAMVPVHTALVKMIAAVRGEHSPIGTASHRERAVSLFDHLSPRYQYRYTPEQVRQRFIEAGLRDVKDVTLANEARHMVAFVGVKGAD